jgi:WD40 repeat protein
MADRATLNSQARVAGERANPFLGLESYKEADAEWFFGRTNERRIVIGQLRTSRLTVLYAESGVGKSSLLRAGVSARLREVALARIEDTGAPLFAPVVFNQWKDDPVKDLIAAIEHERDFYSQAAKAAGSPREPSLDRPSDKHGPGPSQPPGSRPEATDGLAATIKHAAATLDATFLIILDQFEEHFNYQSHPELLADELATCINRHDVRANFLIAIREDAYGRMGDLFRGRIANVYGNYLHLEFLTEQAAREAIDGPVGVYNDKQGGERVKIDPELTRAVLGAVRRVNNLVLGSGQQNLGGERSTSDEIETPFLQLVMARVWQRERIEPRPGKRSTTLRKSTLDELGGAEEIVRNHLIGALEGLSPAELEAAVDIFSLLVTPSGAKIAHTEGDLAKITGHSGEVVKVVVERLAAERIVRAQDPAPGSKDTRWELFHDKLARPVLDWRNQRENTRENIRLEGERRRAQAEADRQRRQARRFRVLAVAAGLLAIACLVVLGFAVAGKRAADKAKSLAQREAATSTWIALYSSAQLAVNSPPDVPLSLALAAYRFRPQAPAASSMTATLESFRNTRALAVLHGTPDTVNAVAFAPSARVVASAGGDGTIRLWDVRTRRQIGEPLRGNPHTGVVGVAFSPDGGTLASAGGFDPTVRLWDARTHHQIGHIPADESGGYVFSTVFSPDGRILASAGVKEKIALWNVRTRTRIGAPFRCPGCEKITSVAFTPNGALLASGGYDHTVRMWAVKTHRQVARMTGRMGTVYAVAFSPDGRTLASAGTDGTIHLWSVATHAPEGQPLRVSSRPVTGLTFSRDDELAASDVDGTVTRWNIHTHREVGLPLSADVGTVLGVSFSHDGRLLASADTNGTILLWNTRALSGLGAALSGHRSDVNSVAASPDGHTIASGSAGGTIRLWDVRTHRGLGVLSRRHARAVRGLVFSPDGQALASGGDDGAITLWNLRRRTYVVLAHDHKAINALAFSPGGQTLAWADNSTITLWHMPTHQVAGHLAGRQGVIHSLAFSPDGSRLGSAGGSGTLRLWDPQTQGGVGQYRLSDAPLRSVAFSPDGRVLAAGGDDKRIHLWSLRTRSQLGTLYAAPGGVLSVAFSPDGRVLASGGSDDTVRVWDVQARIELGPPLAKHQSVVNSVAFTPDGRTLASGSSDSTVRVWQGIFWHNLPDLEQEVCGIIGTGLSRAEWSRYEPGIPYRESCSTR